MYHISSCKKNHARTIKFHQKYFLESIHFEQANPDKIGSDKNRYKNIDRIENNLMRFQVYPETEVACKYTALLYKTQ